MKRISSILLKNIVSLIIVCAITACLIIYPKDTAQGIKSGFLLLVNSLIPSLFPFMVLSSYIAQSGISEMVSSLFKKPFQHIFKTDGYGIVSLILGLLGGYPVGAKTVAELYTNGKITQNDAQRLLYWCINPSPAFAVTAVGTFMLGNTGSGLILYASCLLSSLTVGLVCRFLSDGEKSIIKVTEKNNGENAFVKSVTKGSEAMLSVCGWVLTFSVLSSLCEALNLPHPVSVLIKSAAEVTTGCENAAASNLSLPVIAAILGFGGFAVICQCGVYSAVCKTKTKFIICSRLLNSALSTIYCSLLLKLFPRCAAVSVVIGTGTSSFTLYHSLSAAVILITMCILLILEVDNRKKVC